MRRTFPGSSRWPAILGAALLAIFALGGTACGGGDEDDDEQPTATAGAGAAATAAASPTSVPLEGEIVVFAASSLTEAFKDAGAAFQTANPKTKVTFNFAASSALAVQINELAPADVFASADLAQMKAVTAKGNANEPQTFAKNTPVIVIPKDSSLVATFADLAKPDVRLVLAGANVPIGRYAREVLMKASAAGGVSRDFSTKVLANLKSEEANVRAVLTKVQLGEADAGVVYRTDIGAAKNDVEEIEIPENFNVIAEYPIATLKESKNAKVADAFVAFIRAADGQAILQKYGFTTP